MCSIMYLGSRVTNNITCGLTHLFYTYITIHIKFPMFKSKQYDIKGHGSYLLAKKFYYK